MSNGYKYIINNGEILKNLKKEDKFNKGRSLYEVIKVVQSVPIFLEKHMERLHNSSSITNLQEWLTDDYIKQNLYSLIKVNKVSSGSLKFVLDFGEKRFTAYFQEKNFPSIEQYKQGVKVSFYSKERNNPNAKVLNVNFRKELDKFIKKENIFEAILIDKNEDMTEGSKSNIFVVENDKIYTTPLKNVLPGTTRKVVFDICREEGIEIIEKKINKDEINKIQAMFISSTPFDILPIKELQGKMLCSAHNKIIQNIMNKYNEKVKEYIKENKFE